MQREYSGEAEGCSQRRKGRREEGREGRVGTEDHSDEVGTENHERTNK